MYKNCKIITPSQSHKFTFIMLHPMHCDASYFNDFLCYFKNIKNNNINFKAIKFIFPEASLMDIDYPNNKLDNIQSWYNYYTCYDNINKIDKISVSDFEKSCMNIVNIIHNEAYILKNFKKIYIIGISQGGTLLFNILNKLPRNIGGLFVIKSIYMDKYIKLKKNTKTPIYIYSGSKDSIYSLKFQKKCLKKLKNYKLYHTIIKDLDHFSIEIYENDFIINSFLDTLIH